MASFAAAFTFTVSAEEIPSSLRGCLHRRGFSKKLIKKLRLQDRLTVNGSFRRMIDPVAAGDIVAIDWPEQPPEKQLIPAPEPTVPILYEDGSFVAFDKPPGLPIHPSARHYRRSLGNYFAWLYPGLPFRPIGRLDKDTTGVCLVAKNPFCAAAANESAEKSYYAIAEGSLPLDEGVIRLPLARTQDHALRRRVDEAGQNAVTRFQVLDRSGPDRPFPAHTLIAAALETGRTHQIRAHFAHLGFPLAGDSLYGGSTSFISRQALHCGSIRFYDPAGKRRLCISSPFPPDMAQFFPGPERTAPRPVKPGIPDS